jgi:hypothetical protein
MCFRLGTQVSVALAPKTLELLPQVRYALREVNFDAAVIYKHVVHLKISLLACLLAVKPNEAVVEAVPCLPVPAHTQQSANTTAA